MGELNKEMVNHPSHYNMGSIEVIDAIEAWNLNFSLGSAVKYIARAGHKDDIIQDLEKAKWYVNREIERIKKEKTFDGDLPIAKFAVGQKIKYTGKNWIVDCYKFDFKAKCYTYKLKSTRKTDYDCWVNSIELEKENK